MTYKLLPTGRGVIIDRVSVFCDVKGSAELSFSLPDSGQYAAALIDEHGTTYDVTIKDGKLVLPPELLRPQVLQLYVVKTDQGSITATYACEPLVIRSMADARASVFELTGAATEDDLRRRMVELEEAFCLQGQKCDAYAAQVATLDEKLIKAVAGFNVAVETVNALQERVTAIEANYDPTIIK